MNRSLLKHIFLGVLIISSAGCAKHCVDCNIETEIGLDLIAEENGFCGTEDDIDLHEEELLVEYQCMRCVAQTTTGPISTDFLCGDRAFRDSVEEAFLEPALAQGLIADCAYYRDTLTVTCFLADE